MTVEQELRAQIRMTKVRAAVLGAIHAAGVIAAGALLPKITATFISIERKRPRLKLLGVVARLQEKGLVKINACGEISLTKTGERLLERYRAPKRPRTWDCRWRLVLFDVPERKRPSRVKLRQMLSEIGFYRLQDSAWVYPFDCEEIISLLKLDFRLGTEVQYIIAEKIENDTALRRHFELS